VIEAAVVDACVAIKWVIEEPGSKEARLLFPARLEAPDVMLVECASILWKKVQSRELTEKQVLERWDALAGSPVALVPSGELLEVALRLSLEIDHPVYDCLYMALAIKNNVPLITDDRDFFKAARRKKITASHIVLLSKMAISR
jgi:predicted nucleic acid-binding protein